MSAFIEVNRDDAEIHENPLLDRSFILLHEGSTFFLLFRATARDLARCTIASWCVLLSLVLFKPAMYQHSLMAERVSPCRNPFMCFSGQLVTSSPFCLRLTSLVYVTDNWTLDLGRTSIIRS